MAQKLRILVLNYEFPPLGGGGGVAAHKLAKGFIALGHEVDYVTTWFTGLKEREVMDGITIHRVKVIGRKELPTATMASMLSFVPAAKRKVRELAKIHRYDLINTHFAVPTGPVGVYASRLLGIPNILSLHGGDLYDPTKFFSPHRHFALRAVVSWVMRHSDVLVAQSSNTRSNALSYYKINKEVVIIPLAYEPITFKRATREKLGLSKKKKYLISVGRMVKRKGFDKLIEAAAKLKDKDVEVLLLGAGPELETLQTLAKKLQVTVHFPGFVSEEEKFQYLAVSDMYVLSSVHEGFGIVLQEAMQVGLPIVVTDHGGQVDLIKNGENGFVTSQDNLAAPIEQILHDRQRAKKFSDNNLERVKRFSPRAIAKEYLEHYGKR